ncbi:MAG: SufB/SufD family protein [bacterium]
MPEMQDLDKRALAAKDKKAQYGSDIDLDRFQSEPVLHDYIQDVRDLPEADRERMILAGIDTERSEKSGAYIQKDKSVLHAHSWQEGLEVTPIREALAKDARIRDYYWKLLDVDTDKYTARARIDLHDGYVIRALPGSQVIYPVQACLYMEKNGSNQNIHNIIIAEEGSELHIISGCTTSIHVQHGLHIGITEFYVKKKARLSFTMINSWAEDMVVRPRSAGRIEEDGLFLNNYICMRPVKSLQTYPTAYLVGKRAVARFYSMVVASPGSEIDAGGRIFLREQETRAEIISRAITNGGRIVARGDLVGEVAGVKAHLECRGLILNGGSMHAIPELEGKVDGVEMSHEAAVGKIAQEEILYLMSRGLSEDEATSTIVRGFLNVDIPGLPSELKKQIDRAVGLSEQDMM